MSVESPMNSILAFVISILALATLKIGVSYAAGINTDKIDKIKSDIYEQKFNSKCLLKSYVPIINHPNKYRISQDNKFKEFNNVILTLNNGKVIKTLSPYHKVENKPLLSLNSGGIMNNDSHNEGLRIDLDNVPLQHNNLKFDSLLKFKNLINNLNVIFHFELKDRSKFRVRKKLK